MDHLLYSIMSIIILIHYFFIKSSELLPSFSSLQKHQIIKAVYGSRAAALSKTLL